MDTLNIILMVVIVLLLLVLVALLLKSRPKAELATQRLEIGRAHV